MDESMTGAADSQPTTGLRSALQIEFYPGGTPVRSLEFDAVVDEFRRSFGLRPERRLADARQLLAADRVSLAEVDTAIPFTITFEDGLVVNPGRSRETA